MKKLDPASLEVLAAIGAWTLHNAQGKPEVAEAIWNDLLPQFKGRYPHEKKLSHWTQDAKEPVREIQDAEKVQILTVAQRLSAKLPTGEVLSFDVDEALALADALHERGIAMADVICPTREEDPENVRAVADLLYVVVMDRLRRLENSEWRKEANAAWHAEN